MTSPSRPTPPAWDPLGAAPFAWDLPDPNPAPPVLPPPLRPRSKVTSITLGLALLAGGITAAFLPAISPAQVAAVALGVIGLGLVIGSLLHRGRGLIVVAAPLALVTWLLHAVPFTDASASERWWSAATPAQLRGGRHWRHHHRRRRGLRTGRYRTAVSTPVALDTSVAVPLLVQTHRAHGVVVRW